jgi:hypothetical protein
MVNQQLIAGILLGGMIPVSPPPKFDMTTDQFDLASVMKSGMVVDLVIHSYQVMVAALTELYSKPARKTMKTSDNNPDWASSLNQEPPVTGAAGPEIIAAIITAGMLPTLPVPKLRRLTAEGISDAEMQPAFAVIAGALHMYMKVLETLRYAEARLEDRDGELQRRDN